MSGGGKRPPRGRRTKSDLTDAVYDRHGGLTKEEAGDIVDAIFRTMKASLLDGRPVRIKNFGVFEVIERRGRKGVSPASGERIFIPRHRGLAFRPAGRLRDELDPEPSGES